MLKSFFTLRTWPVIAALLSLSLWLGALAFEHIGKLAPCQMCYWQRNAHKLVIAVAVLALLIRFLTKSQKYDRLFAVLIALAFAVSSVFAFWHVGVEYKWWEGPKTCMAAPGTFSAESLMKALSGKVKIPVCGEAPWHFFGISMAGYNTLISAIATLPGLWFGLKKGA